MKYTENQLYDFVYRADTPQKVATAERWLKENVTDNNLFDDLMIALSMQSREIYAAQSGRQYHI